ncbi:MAG TPA: hypothetical protein VMS76_11840 [Planctomycetota bacterium]|nr:hypothetical protein [Planctomycetota bacterium]
MLASLPMCLAAALALVLAPWSPVPAAQDERTLAVLEEARRVAEQAGEGVWPGFSLSAIPIALFSDDTALLVHHPAPPPGFEPLASSLSTPLWRGPRTAEMNANTSGRLAGAVTAFVSIASLGSGKIGAADVALLIHEAGHAFRDRAPGGGEPRWPSEDASLVASYPVDSPANNAWGRIEGAILREALEAADRARTLELARDFVAVRLRRQRGLDPALARFERDLELNEGLAEYFACKAIELTDPSSALAPAARERGLDPREYGPAGDHLARLRDELGRINAGGRGAARQRFYATGAAQGLLLDRLGVDWKVAVEAGANLETQLARAAEADELAARLERIAAQRGFDDLARRERLAADAAAALRRKKLVDLLAEPGRKLVLDLSAAGGAGELRSFDPLNVVPVEPGVHLHTRMLVLGFRGGEARFERAVVQDLERGLAIAALPQECAVELDRGAGTARISGAGLSVACRDASWVEDGEVLVLKPGGAGETIDPAPHHARIEAARAEAKKPRPAPPFESPDLAGAVHRHPESSPRTTALVFFSAADWARPSHALAGELLARMREGDLASDRARILLVASQCTRSELDGFLAGASGRRVLHDPDRTLAGLFGVERYPTVVWIDPEGTVASVEVGRREGDAGRILARLRDG